MSFIVFSFSDLPLKVDSNSLWYLKKNISLFDCVRSKLQHRVRAVSKVCRLRGCGSWAKLLCGMWDFRSLTRGLTHVPCIRRRVLTCWGLLMDQNLAVWG